MFGSVVINRGHKYWFHPYINKITNKAAIFVLLIGTKISMKNFIGFAPSILAASTISFGMVIKNCLNKKVAVADAINRNINPAHYQAKKVKKFLEIKTIKEKKVKKIFNTKDHVVYPTHGVGQVIDIEKREVVGQKLEMYVIEFVRDKLILRVPVEKAKSLNLRKVSKPSKIQTVLKILSQKPKIKRTMWSRRAQEYDLKINSGDIEQIAEVVRDLNRANNQIEQSYSERQLFELSYDRFLREVIAGLKITEENAIKKVDKILGRDKLKNAPSLLN